MWRFFSAICPPLQPPFTEREPHKSYLTFESLQKFLPIYFGPKCDFLVQGIFSILSDYSDPHYTMKREKGIDQIVEIVDDIKLQRIYFKTFLERFYFKLWHENPREREEFIFKLIDHDKDGIITGHDILKCYEFIDIDSKFGEEIQLLDQHYIKTHLKIRGKPNSKEQINFDMYIQLIFKRIKKTQHSCLVEEI